jgi:hypothetical protein
LGEATHADLVRDALALRSVFQQPAPAGLRDRDPAAALVLALPREGDAPPGGAGAGGPARWSRHLLAVAASVAAAVLLLAALATASALPQEPGYPWKRALERLWLAAAVHDRAGVALVLAERRLAEAAALREARRDPGPALAGLAEVRPWLALAPAATATALAAAATELAATPVATGGAGLPATVVPRRPSPMALRGALLASPTSQPPLESPAGSEPTGTAPTTPRPAASAPKPPGAETLAPPPATEPPTPAPPLETEEPAEPTRPATPTEPAPFGGSIGGRVVDGAGLGLALVEIELRQLTSPPGTLPRSFGEVFLRFTDQQGRYRAFVPPGHYVVGAGSPRRWWPDAGSVEEAELVEVTAALGAGGIDFVLAGGQAPASTATPSNAEP